MAAFEYEALDATGKRTRGLLSADSEAAARRELRRRRLAPLRVSRTDDRAAPGAAPRLGGPRPISARELAAITRQLATLISAGLPVEEAVAVIGSQSGGDAVSRVLLGVRAKVTEGERLSDAMAAHPRSFPPVYRAMVSAGESAGGLGLVLDRLADYLEKSEALKRKIQSALVYPAVLAVVALGVVGLLLVFIVPRIADQFGSMGLDLPFITRAMMAASSFLQLAWPVLLVIGLAFMALGAVALRREPVRLARDRFVLALPFVGGFVRKVESARFARTLSILIASGAVLPDALRAARRASQNLPFREAAGRIIDQVETGKGLADSLRAASFFPPLLVYMVAAGERSGRLAEMFGRACEHLEADVDASVSTGLSLLEPGIIIVMGVLVAMIVLSILLPILQLNTSVLF